MELQGEFSSRPAGDFTIKHSEALSTTSSERTLAQSKETNGGRETPAPGDASVGCLDLGKWEAASSSRALMRAGGAGEAPGNHCLERG